MNIPFLDLTRQFDSIRDEILAAVSDVLESKKFVQNDFCRKFADEFLAVPRWQLWSRLL